MTARRTRTSRRWHRLADRFDVTRLADGPVDGRVAEELRIIHDARS